jgi:hypothetical protein
MIKRILLKKGHQEAYKMIKSKFPGTKASLLDDSRVHLRDIIMRVELFH